MQTIPYGHQWIDENDIEEVVKVLRSDWITQGPKIGEFEEALCEYTGARYAVVVSNGTAALHISCLAAGIKTGDEVITSPITFVASANCVLYCGGKPIFADVQEDTANIYPDEIAKRVTLKTKAIIPVHFAGHPCDLEEISNIAKEHNLIVIEDAAQALGARYKSSKIGSCKYSDMTIFSFHPVKSITTGEGGAILTNRKDLYKKMLMLRNHGITREKEDFVNSQSLILSSGDWYYEAQELGFNYRLTDFQAALGLSQLKKIDRFVEVRRQLAEIYNCELSQLQEIIPPKERPYVKSSFHIYYIRLKKCQKRKALFKKLRESGIGVQVHYIPIHFQPFYRKKFGYKVGDFPKSEEYFMSTITLPLYPQLTEREISYVIERLKS